jgi:hypothetical protein
MIRSLMRRDPIVRPPWAWLLLILVSLQFALVIRGSAAWMAALNPNGSQGILLSLLAVWVPLVMYQWGAGLTARGSRLDLGLPVPGRAIWTAHLLVYFGMGLVVAAACALLDAGGAFLFMRTRVHPTLPSHSLQLLPHVVGWSAIIAVLWNGVRRDRLRAKISWPHLGLFGLQLAGFGLVWWTGRWSPVIALVPLAAAAGLAMFLARGVPPALTEIVPETRGEHAPVAAAPGAMPAAAGRRLIVRTIWLSFFGPLLTMIQFAPVLIYGWLCSGNLQDMDGSPDSRGAFVLLAAAVLMVAVINALRHLPVLDALPISRRAIFPVLVLPSLLAFAASYGIGRAGSALLARPRERIVFAADRQGQYQLKVPLHDFEIARNGRPPDTVSPWGESHSPRTIEVQPGTQAVLYNPFATPPGSSLDFVALQISRAMMAVHGTTLPPETIRDRYLALDDSGRVVASPGSLTLMADDPGLRVRGYGPVSAIMLALTGVPYFLMLAVALRVLRRRCGEAVRRTVLWIAMALTVGGMLLYLAGAIADWWDPDIHWTTVRILIRHAATNVPVGGLLIWGMCLAAVWASYKLAETQFEELEAPARPEGSCGWWMARPS